MHSVKKRRHVVLHLPNDASQFHPVYTALIHAAAQVSNKELKRELLEAAKYVSPTVMDNADGQILNVYPYIPRLDIVRRCLLKAELVVLNWGIKLCRQIGKIDPYAPEIKIHLWDWTNKVLLIEQRLKDSE